MPHDESYVPLTAEFIKDIQWWCRFLPNYNGVSMMMLEEWSAPDEVVACDSCLIACGGVCQSEFFHVAFPQFILDFELHINVLEL